MRFSARLIAAFFSFLLLFFLVSTPSFAQSIKNGEPVVSNFNNPGNMHYYTQNILSEIMSAMVCQLAGVDPVNPNQKCVGIDPKAGKIGFVSNNGGLVGLMGSLISSTYSIPVHTIDYISYLDNNFGIAKKSYAQGIGFVGLQPVLGIHTTFRNVAYLLFVLIFIIIGMAIMLRVKIDPRTVMTIQNQIPKIVIGLIMITFSYAIAGFLIDLMWVGTYFMINTLTPVAQHGLVVNSITNSAPGFVDSLYSDKQGIIGIAGRASTSVGQIISSVISSPTVVDSMKTAGGTGLTSCINDPLSAAIFAIPFIGTASCAITQLTGGTIGSLMIGVMGFFLGFIGGIIAFLIFVIAILVQLFRLWFTLLKSFIAILLDVILAPFWILGGLIPGAGQNMGFGAWIKDLIANLAVFPAVVFIFLISRIVMDGFAYVGNPATAFNPPLIGNAGSGSASIFGSLIAVGFILSAPSLVEAVKKALKAGGFGGQVGGLSTGQAVVSGAIGGVMGRAFKVNPNTQEAMGPGSRFMQNKVNNRATRFFLGFNSDKPEDAKNKSMNPGPRPSYRSGARLASRKPGSGGGGSTAGGGGGTPPSSSGGPAGPSTSTGGPSTGTGTSGPTPAP